MGSPGVRLERGCNDEYELSRRCVIPNIEVQCVHGTDFDCRNVTFVILDINGRLQLANISCSKFLVVVDGCSDVVLLELDDTIGYILPRWHWANKS